MALNQSWINVFEIISRRRAQWYSLFGTSCITSACSIASSKRNSVTWHDVLGSLPFNILSRCATVGYVGLQSLNSLPQASIMYNKNKTYSHLSITIFSLYNFDVSSLIFFIPIAHLSPSLSHPILLFPKRTAVKKNSFKASTKKKKKKNYVFPLSTQ